ncbi:response regulator [Larkinella soli]|uniref:response regulator n=1 Tax=Larkinella soli TaxID=1770527 RepID=UPI000FFB3667|nr:response regulator [Larkinella soli]
MNPVQIYLAEDDEDDALLFRMTLKQFYPEGQVLVFDDGEALLLALESAAVPPTFIFLDINMPRLNGLETLEILRANPRTAAIPTFVFSSSNYDADIQRAYELGATSYFVKPHKISRMVQMFEQFSIYWNQFVTHPGHPLTQSNEE